MKSKTLLFLCGAVCALATASCGGGGDFDRADLDAYVASHTDGINASDGAEVYIDFSNGMIDAYGTDAGRRAISGILNKLTTASGQVPFYSLAEDKITPLELPQTEIYNTVMNPANYDKEQAPLEKALQQITSGQKSALLITDFEEYNGTQIQQQNYAKDYFIKWLTSGKDIVFYKIDYTEKGKQKKLFFCVFDDTRHGLTQLVDEVMLPLLQTDTAQRYILKSRDFLYNAYSDYPSAHQGGNYHDSQGVDAVTAVLEDGSSQAWVNYAQPVAKEKQAGKFGQYAESGVSQGFMAQYYPIGVSWADVVANAKAMQEEGVPADDRFEHLIGNLYLHLAQSDAFDVDGFEARVFNLQPDFDAYVLSRLDSTARYTPVEPREVQDMLVLSTEPANVDGNDVVLANVDLDPKFDGNMLNANPGDLLRVDIVVREATPKPQGIDEFFAWPGNTSLSESVHNTLLDSRVSPKGSILYSYYLKAI